MTKFLTYAYIISLPFTSAFALTGVLTPSLLILLALSVLFLIGFILGTKSLTIDYVDVAALLFWVSVVASFFLNAGSFLSAKPLNHMIAYSFVILANYYMLRNIITDQIIKKKISFETLTFLIGIGILITSILGMIEFVAKNIYFIDVDQYIPRVAVEKYKPFASGFIRIRSVIEESGHLAFYYEILGPIGLYGVRKNRKLFFLTLITMILGFIFSFSSAGWIIAGGILAIILIERTVRKLFQVDRKVKVLRFMSLITFSLLVIAGIFYFYKTIGAQILEATVYDKVTASGSANDRSERVVQVFETLKNANVFHWTFGYGPAAYDSLRYEAAALVLYFTFLIESGVLGLSLFLFFVLFNLINIISIKDKTLKTIFLCSFVAALVHFVSISNYWYPWFWVLIILSQIAKSQLDNKELKEANTLQL